MDLITSIINGPNAHKFMERMQSEASWTLANLAFGTKEVLDHIIQPQFGIAQFIKTVLEGNNQTMITNVLWFLSNLIATSPEFYEWTKFNTFALELINDRLLEISKKNSKLLQTICWFVNNYTMYAEDFSENEDFMTVKVLKFGIEQKNRVFA